MSADNQQERLDEKWIVGFVDGEGCFHVGINKQQKMSLGFQILPEFRVVQHQRDKKILFEFKKYFGFGKCPSIGYRYFLVGARTFGPTDPVGLYLQFLT